MTTMILPETDARWTALTARDRAFDARFVYAVKTTGIYCRPSCPSRRAKRENVAFFDTPAAAAAAGFRACLRCRPDAASQGAAQAAAMARVCAAIERAEEPPTLAAMAREAGLSVFHFHRQFKAAVGVTPKAYAAAHRMRRARTALAREGASVTEAIYQAGFNSGSRFYAAADAALGMSPTRFRDGGAGTEIRFAVGECSLGSVLVAQSAKGLCAILLGDDPAALVRELQDRFPKAALVGGDARFEAVVARVVGFVDRPKAGLDLQLDIRGTAFQQRVWDALRKIPLGETVSYTDIAERIGHPKAVRAVAGACAANHLAVVIPCHRVIRRDGDASGYRWGVERKRALLEKERG